MAISTLVLYCLLINQSIGKEITVRKSKVKESIETLLADARKKLQGVTLNGEDELVLYASGKVAAFLFALKCFEASPEDFSWQDVIDRL